MLSQLQIEAGTNRHIAFLFLDPITLHLRLLSAPRESRPLQLTLGGREAWLGYPINLGCIWWDKLEAAQPRVTDSPILRRP